MAERCDRDGKPDKTGKGQRRQARLEQALRVNLLKRKEKARAAQAAETPPKEGGQD